MSAERAHLRVVPDPEEATAKDGQRQIKAIMFSDIKGYSAMMGKDEDQAFKLLDIHNRLIESRVETFHGTIIKYIGDAVLASFSSAVDAADCALSIQTEFARINKGRPRRDQIWIRIGLHLGDVLLKDGDVFGDGVNLASRLEPLSQPGGIVVSGTIKDTIQANPRFQIEPMGEVQLKNIPYRVWAFQILTPSSGNPLLRKVFKKSGST
ncbi:MAG: adenylate/guanylate cyclase domain-containing protein [Nitrospinae bacterium]|nr:adenylate/guanylate cyclase domain-containing protein [Nitrospinota bacterium]